MTPAADGCTPALRWTRLAVLRTQRGGLSDSFGTVRFRAIYVRDGQRGVLAETSEFVRDEGRWTYLGPDLGPDAGDSSDPGRVVKGTRDGARREDT